MQLLEDYAPLSISKRLIEQGDYDNSGVIVKSCDTVNGVLFTLDLTVQSVKRAKALGINTIVTHHPAIYTPIKSLECDNPNTCAVLSAIKQGINVISMHLNLDMATHGIDESLALGLGAKEYKIIDKLDQDIGYGREFNCNLTLGDIVKNVKKEFGTQKVIAYGKKTQKISKIASFCGAGVSQAVKAIANRLTSADLIVTSDVPHHLIKEIIENGLALVILPHYVAEVYGFKKFYQEITKNSKGLKTYFLDDVRFR